MYEVWMTCDHGDELVEWFHTYEAASVYRDELLDATDEYVWVWFEPTVQNV